ncbi:MAG: hypothetical protein IJC64_03475 [Clostridia bacterium]|nr:hypothetical protein [Clostridia bacterium]
MRKQLGFLALAIIFLLLPLPSCAKKQAPSCREVLTALIDAEGQALPAGRIYDMRAGEDGAERLPDSLLPALLGEGKMPAVSNAWLDCAMFLSVTEHPCELIIFLCTSRDAATDTARLLCSRLDAIKVSKSSEKYSDMLSAARVGIYKNYAFLIISRDPAAAQKTLEKILR